MKIQYILENIDCANCAAKVEKAVLKINGVNNCTVNFLSAKMLINIDEQHSKTINENIEKAINKVNGIVMLKRI